MRGDSEIRSGEEVRPVLAGWEDARRVVRLGGPAIPVLASTGTHSPRLELCVLLWSDEVVLALPYMPLECV